MRALDGRARRAVVFSVCVPGRDEIWDRRLVLVTGKGGVGKSTIAAALAKAAHRAGRRVLVGEVASEISPQSHLLAHFGPCAGDIDEPRSFERNLWGVRLTPSTGHRLFLREALRVRMVVDAAMKSAALRRFLMAAPAFPEIGTLFQLVSLLRDDRFDNIILDLPATGHALGLASLPKVVLRVVPSGLIGNAIREGLAAMTDAARSGAVLVTLPEDMPVTEGFELHAALQRLGIPVRAMVLNRMPETPFSDEERAALDAHIRRRKSECLLGGREFRKIERAIAARQMFRDRVPPSTLAIEMPHFCGETSRAIVEDACASLAKAANAPNPSRGGAA